MYFEFEKKENLDERSLFANKILQLIYQKNFNNIDKAVKEAEMIGIFEDFEEYIKNVYELVESEIPLYAYYRLLKYGANNYGFTEEEFNKAKDKTIKACKMFYS